MTVLVIGSIRKLNTMQWWHSFTSKRTSLGMKVKILKSSKNEIFITKILKKEYCVQYNRHDDIKEILDVVLDEHDDIVHYWHLLCIPPGSLKK